MQETDTQQKTKRTTRPKMLSGVVVSDRMNDSIVVAVTRYVKHPKYKKYQKKVKRYTAHDAGNTKNIGEKVVIEECKPISKTKRFRVV